MKERRTSLKVKEVEGEPFRYWVESESGDQPYLVDLTERVVDGSAYGRCSCINFETRMSPKFRETGIRIPYRRDADGKLLNGCTECKHIGAARSYMEIHTVLPMLAKFNKGISGSLAAD